MKTTLIRTLALLLCLLTLCTSLALTSCTEITDSERPLDSTEQVPEITLQLTVTDLNGEQKHFDISAHTEDSVADALVNSGLVQGDDTEYGLYIKVVNGVTADWNTDGTYWSFYVDGEMSMVGASSVKVANGMKIELKREGGQ